MLYFTDGNFTDNSDISKDVTGQGIHTDGSNNQGIVCIERDNIAGAETQFHYKLDGTCPMTDPFTLEPGHSVFFKDNQMYHSVSNMTKRNSDSTSRRTVLLISDTAEMYLLGKQNPNNTLQANESNIKLKNV